MSTEPQGASTVEDFLNDDPNTITAADTTETVAQKTVFNPNAPKKSPGKYKNWRDNFVRPSGLNLTDVMLPPITRRKFATYETIQDYKIDHRIQEHDKAILPPPLDLPPTYVVFDKGEKDWAIANKLIKNVVRSEVRQVRQADGQIKPIVDEVLDYVSFINGQKIVDIHQQYLLFVFLELHPLNQSSKFRDNSKKPRFRRVDFDNKSRNVQMLEMDLQDDAMNYLRKLSDKEIINLASAMTNPTIPTVNVATSEIRYNLRLRARNNPEEILYKAPDKKASTRIDIIHALEMEILFYLPERHAYFLANNEQDPLFICSIEANPLEDLAQFLASPEGKEEYDAIMDYMTFWKP